jgi:ABC-type multidrug transport system ATPase subunit
MGTTQPTSVEDHPPVLVRGVVRRYRRLEAVRGVDLQVHRGIIFGLVGPDGAGKSSLFKMIAGLLRPDAGEIEVLGRPIPRAAEEIRPRLGFMPQGLGLLLSPNLTVEQNLRYFADLHGVSNELRLQRQARLLAMTQMDRFLDRRARNLSGGMKQKLSLCCVLVHQPELLILDEPTTGVDPISRRQFWDIINELVSDQHITVMLSTAYMDEADRCHEMAFMFEGRILLTGSPPVLAARTETGRLQDLFVERIRSAEQPPSSIQPGTAPPGGTGPPAGGVRGSASSEGASDVKGGHEGAAGPHFPVNGDPEHDGISVRGLTRRFGSFVAVDHISFDVRPGEVFGFLGPNGAGKTTAVKMLCCILPATEGQATVGGFDLHHQRHELKANIGYMSQEFSLYKDLTVRENLLLYAAVYGLRLGDPRIEEVAEFLQLPDLYGMMTRDLPIGFRQRLGVACAILHRPHVLFLDEPTSGVDPLVRRRIWRIIRRLSREWRTTVLVTTHHMEEAEECDRLALIDGGELVAVDTPRALKDTVIRDRGQMLVVHAEPFMSARRVCRQACGEVALYGRELHVFAPPGQTEAVRCDLRERLSSAGLNVVSVEVEDVLLEDAFIYHIRRRQQERRAGP